MSRHRWNLAYFNKNKTMGLGSPCFCMPTHPHSCATHLLLAELFEQGGIGGQLLQLLVSCRGLQQCDLVAVGWCQNNIPVWSGGRGVVGA